MWKVTEVVPLKRIKINWKYESYQGDSFVVFELTMQDDLAKLRLTHQVQESFSQDIPKFRRESGVAGWTFFIKKSLKKILEKSQETGV